MASIVILGGGTAGTIVANRLRRRYRTELRSRRTTITVIDTDGDHVYQPGLLFLPFGLEAPTRLVRQRRQLLHPDVTFIEAPIRRLDTGHHVVELADGTRVGYAVLIIATGARVAPAETEGMTGVGWRERIFDFYTLDGALALRRALAAFRGGRLVVNVADVPIKGPVAPLEFVFLADWYFRQRGIRERVYITYITPLDAAFPEPVASAALAHLLEDKGIELVTEFSTGSVDGAHGALRSRDDREVPFDLLVSVPVHRGAEIVRRTPGLGDDLGFVLTDPRTLQAQLAPNVFAIGDATNIPTAKVGSVAQFQAEVLARNVERFLDHRPLVPEFDGHANCFIETGHHKALLIDFNYDVEPLPGAFPMPYVGPLRLLAETRLNHVGKLALRWMYWHVLMPGLGIPGVPARMSMRGKHHPPPPTPPAVSPRVREPELVESAR
jgi:sulfide:quinone oxidoreductase